jgi:hypothetical protein
MIQRIMNSESGETDQDDVDAANVTTALYDRASARVEIESELWPYKDTILADWPEGDEHWHWVAEASTNEILTWAEIVQEESNAE